MSRVMLVCPEPLAHRQPAGVGIRFVEMSKVLHDDGHDIALLSPANGTIAPETLRDVSERSDVAVVQGHIANDFFAHARAIPTVVDLYDPFIVENLHYYAERGAEVFTHDHATLINSLLRGDFFLCASEAQRLFYLGLLIATGRLNPALFETDPHLDSLLRIAPFGVAPPRPMPASRPNAVLFGGIYDWYDPILAIDAIEIARASIDDLTLTFTQHPNAAITPQGQADRAMKHAKGKSFVEFVPWTAYDVRGEFFDRFSAALLTFPQSIETDLSMRTRVYDYLWGGLPIVTSSAPGTDELLLRYGAGLIVDSDSPHAFAHALLSALRDQERLRAGTQRFVDDHQWPRVLQPLVDFVRAPRVDATKEMPQRPPSILDRIKRRIGGRA